METSRKLLCLIGFILPVFLLVVLLLALHAATKVSTKPNSPKSYYLCNCSERWGKVDCYELLQFRLEKHSVLLCGIKSLSSSIRIVSDVGEYVTYSHKELEKLETFFDQCFGDNTVCSNWVKTHYNVTKASIHVEDCQWYMNIERLLTLCFGANRDLNRGFVNQTVFSVKELIQLYKIMRYFALEPWLELTSDHSMDEHYPYRLPQYYG